MDLAIDLAVNSMKLNLRIKLSASYIFVALLLVVLISVAANLLLEKQFKNYIIKQLDERSNQYISLISQQYFPGNGWNNSTVENVGLTALEQGMIIKVKDVNGNTIWDATMHNSGFCTQMLKHMSKNMQSHYPDFNGGYQENSFPLNRNNVRIGTVNIGYYGPFYFTDNDLAFINTLNGLLITIGIISLVIAIILGSYMSKRLSKPISRVINSAQQISKGYFSGRINEDSSTEEIIQLTTAVNDMAESLESQETLRKRMSADVAHELRTPIATLQSHMEAMIDGIWTADTERLKSCHEEIVRIGKLVGNLETLARFESENLVLHKTAFNISELIQCIITNFEPEFLKKGIELEFSGDEVQINADRDKISQVIINLVSNSLKYTNPGGKVSVEVQEYENECVIEVRDSGVGIPPEDIKYIFERFYRADKSRNRLTGGSGIGLAIVKSIVEAHKGHVKVRSELNKGSEFTVILPKEL